VKYRKRPVVIEAIQFTGDNVHEIEAFGAAGIYADRPRTATRTT
jgi:hypothetical protein